MQQAYTTGMQPATLLPLRVNWFDPFAVGGSQPRSASIAGDAGATIETVTATASRLPPIWLLAVVGLGIYGLWRASR